MRIGLLLFVLGTAFLNSENDNHCHISLNIKIFDEVTKNYIDSTTCYLKVDYLINKCNSLYERNQIKLAHFKQKLTESKKEDEKAFYKEEIQRIQKIVENTRVETPLIDTFKIYKDTIFYQNKQYNYFLPEHIATYSITIEHPNYLTKTHSFSTKNCRCETAVEIGLRRKN